MAWTVFVYELNPISFSGGADALRATETGEIKYKQYKSGKLI